jgi:hypothetical protein
MLWFCVLCSAAPIRILMTLWSRYQTCLKGTACLTLLGSGGADADKAAVEVLDALAGKYRNDKLNFAQVDGTVQTGFAEALGGKDGLPALVVIKGKRDKKMK